MKIFLFISFLALLISESALGQTKKETITWLNEQGEEYLKEVTGNSSIYWQIDNFGNLKITNYQISDDEDDKIVKRYSYLNLYELDSENLHQIEDNGAEVFALRCKSKSNSCIKNRNYFSNTDFETYESSSLVFWLQKSIDTKKIKELENKLICAIQMIDGSFSTRTQ